jgi:hypothetical protein
MALAAASFLGQALELPDDPATIATELTTIEEAAHAAIFSVELDSSIGAAAFLLYVYALGTRDPDGGTGRDRYQEGMQALQQAADRDTPGPRMVAHADTDALGFILATTPATWRALQGDDQPRLVATESDLPTGTGSPDQRASHAEDLHRSLKEASEHAASWLAAVRTVGDAELSFTEEETALALFVLDQANIQPVLGALNLLVTAAQDQAGQAFATKARRSPDDR